MDHFFLLLPFLALGAATCVIAGPEAAKIVDLPPAPIIDPRTHLTTLYGVRFSPEMPRHPLGRVWLVFLPTSRENIRREAAGW